MSTSSESMLAIAGESDKRKAVPNLLPCRIRHTGPIDSVAGYWAPSSPKQDEPRVAYFRGRKLHGRAVAVPDRYEGVVVRREAGDRKRKHSQLCGEDEDDGAVAAEPETETLRVTARFDEVLVWAHEATMDSTDEYVRGVEEWLQVADKIHSFGERDETSG
ncbi:ribonuclease H2 subunit C [Ophiocordyceps camponoti-floridani]|uniref:Ribonuclease H2 subunit C n=1 Tax=Ophiocordyceps camponoti-floridani TaxID=2030778 RepID=A0A8H4VBY8_9HYPO|nr:ribonuclease H2 subunit C [Ophiocordyceps camponoti-floridani]